MDTSFVIWLATDPTMLTDAERRLIDATGTEIVLSAVAVWEIRPKWHSFYPSGARKGSVSPAQITQFAEELSWELLPLTATHAAQPLRHPLPHRDPFDELLVVKAEVEGMRLLTRDRNLIDHPVSVTSRA